MSKSSNTVCNQGGQTSLWNNRPKCRTIHFCQS
jgi:hypothetical protein